MGQKTFDMLMHLASVGYTVSFNKAEEFKPAQTMKIKLTKGKFNQVVMVDISLANVKCSGLNADDLISRGLERARWEFEYHFDEEGLVQ